MITFSPVLARAGQKFAPLHHAQRVRSFAPRNESFRQQRDGPEPEPQQCSNEFGTLAPSAPERARQLTRGALRAMGQGDFGNAIAKLQQALKLVPNDPKTHAHLARAYGKLVHLQASEIARGHFFAQSVRHFQRSLALNPNDVITHTQLGALYRSRGEFEPAMKHFFKAYELESSTNQVSEKTFMNLAETALAAGNKSIFFSVIELARRRFPNDLHFMGLAAKGKLRFHQYQEAVVIADQILQIDPKDDLALRLQADGLMMLKEFDLATLATVAIQMPYFRHLELAKILLAEGRHLKSRPAILIDPSDREDAIVYFHDAERNLSEIKQTKYVLWLRSEAAFEMGDYRRARQFIGEILAEKIDSPLADYIWLLGAYLKAQKSSQITVDEAWMDLEAILPDQITRGAGSSENMESLKQLVSRINAWNWDFLRERVAEEFQAYWDRKILRPRPEFPQNSPPRTWKQ